MDYMTRVIEDIETHNLEGLRECFQNGVSPNATFRGQPLLHELVSEYARGPSFKQCVQVFVDHGLIYDSKPLLTVFLDDAESLRKLIEAQPDLVSRRFAVRCAYTPLSDASLLHICAEFNHVRCARVLISSGAEIDALAGVDDLGFGGQSPIFHTVNQNHNQSQEMLDLLLEHGADLSIAVRGLVWGQSYPWETLIPAVNPISYAMMGLLPQMHRDEETIARTVQQLMQHRFGIDYHLMNIPNAYLKGG